MSSSGPSRRDLLRLVAGAAGGLALGGGTSGCAGGRADPEAITRVALERVPVGQHVRIDHHGEPVDLLRSDDGVEARSLICTHEYCRMFWHGDGGSYRCPCHGATFDAGGRPATGPVTRPMWTLPARIEDDVVIVGGRV